MSAVDAKAIIINVGVVDGASGPFTRIGTSAQAMGTNVNAGMAKASTGMAAFGAKAAKVGTFGALAIAAGLLLSAKAAITFESSFAGVRKTVDETETGFKRLADGARRMATEIPIGVNELNRIMELGGQLGVESGDLLTFTDTIAKIGVTTTLATDQAAMGFARLDNIMQLNGGSFEEIGSTIVDLGNNFAATEDEILTFTLRIAPMGATVGMATHEVLALATAFTSVGIPAERGGTAVQKTLLKMSDAALDGGKKLNEFSKIAGMLPDQFAELFKDDPAAAFEAFILGLGDFVEAGGNTVPVFDALELGNQRVIQSLLAMSNASGVLTDALDLGATAWGDNIALTEEAQKRFETTASAMIILKNKVQDIAISIGGGLLPAINDLIVGGEAIIDWVNDTDNAFKNLGVAIAGFTLTLAAALAHPVIGGLLAVGAGIYAIGSEAQKTTAEIDAMTAGVKAAAGDLTGDTLREFFRIEFEYESTDQLEKDIRKIGYTWDMVTAAIGGTDEEYKTFMDDFGEGQREGARNRLFPGNIGGVAIPVTFLQEAREKYLGVLATIKSDLAGAYTEIDEEEMKFWGRTFSHLNTGENLRPTITGAPIIGEDFDMVIEALGDYNTGINEAFDDIADSVWDFLDVWYEFPEEFDAAFDDAMASFTRQREALTEFNDRMGELDLHPVVENLIRQLAPSAAAMEAFLALPEIDQSVIVEWAKAEAEAINQTIYEEWNRKRGPVEFGKAGEFVAEIIAGAEEMYADPKNTASFAEIMVGLVNTAADNAEPRMRGKIIEAFLTALEGDGTMFADLDLFGWEIEQLIALLNSLSGIYDVDVQFGIGYTVTGERIPEPLLGYLPEPIKPGKYGRQAFGGTAMADEPKWVGELGPELFVPFNSGTIIPNNKLQSGGDRSTVVNVYRAESNDFPGDISEGLTRASITEQVDMIGAY